MARKPAPKIDPADLYEEQIVFVIAYVDNSAFGRFYSPAQRCQSVQAASQFTDREQAREMIKKQMLENVEILEVWI